MDTNHNDSSDREHRLDEAVAEYLRAQENGAAPDRAEFLARHPDLAADLTSFFDDRDRVEQWAGPLREGPAPGGPPPFSGLPCGSTTVRAADPVYPGPAAGGPGLLLKPGTSLAAAGPRMIGKFELLGVAGKGAFGIVYMAWDTQLAR